MFVILHAVIGYTTDINTGSVRDSGDDDLWSSLYGNEMENVSVVCMCKHVCII